MRNIVYPHPLKSGDTIAIVSPAGAVDPDYVEGTVEVFQKQGWNVEVSPHALGRNGSFSGTCDERLADITSALTDPRVRAVVCSRGGYGAVQLLDSLMKLDLKTDPKWLVGFSDISALHALMLTQGIASVHGPMAKDISRGPGLPHVDALMRLLTGERAAMHFAPSGYNRQGWARGTIAGGNLAVLTGLMGTPYEIFKPGTILFVEDIAEPVYKVERMLYQLKLAGILDNIAGLIVGNFTDYRPALGYTNMEEMVQRMVRNYSFPVAMGAPVGHIDTNMPLIEGARVQFTVTENGADIIYLDNNCEPNYHATAPYEGDKKLIGLL